MSKDGFGFRGPGDGDEQDDHGRQGPGDNPFGAFGFGLGPGFGAGGTGGPGAGGLGDLLNQFGQMLSGMGQTMSGAGADDPVNFAVTERIARQQIGRDPALGASSREAVSDAVRLSELWLDEATTLPVGANRAEAWTPTLWLENTLPTWRRLVTPVAQRMAEASLEQLPEEARAQMGPMLTMLSQVSATNFGMQVGTALGSLAKDAVTTSDFGLPLATTGAAAVLTGHVSPLATELNVPAQELLVYLASREAAHQRLFAHVPWLVERLIAAVQEYAAGLSIDYSAIEEVTRELNLDSVEDPARLQEVFGRLQGMDLTPKVRTSNTAARLRLQTLLALVEGWVDVVVTDALGERLPKAGAIHEAWVRRRATGSSAETAFAQVVGIELGAPRVNDAVDLWRRLGEAVGPDRRDHVWDHPDLVPAADDLDNSAAFIDGVLAGSDGFDPIAELERELGRSIDDSIDDDEDKDSGNS